MQGQRHVCSSPCLRLVSTVVLVTLTFQVYKHPPLATSPQAAGPSASSAISSAGRKRSNVLYST